jgi:MFS family permease
LRRWGTLIGFFLLPGIVMAMPSGALTRAFADKTLLMIGAAVMAVGAATMALADGTTQLYRGRLLTGVGGTIFNLILTKMVTDWFFGEETITALGFMLVAWPIGIALALLTQGGLATDFGWSSVMVACAGTALAALVLIASAYRAPPRQANTAGAGSLRFGVPKREAVLLSIVGICWAIYNATWILLASFGPDALVAQGWTVTAAKSATSLMMWASLLSLPLGGRLMETFGYVTPALSLFLLLAAGITVLLFFGIAPPAMYVSFGLAAGIPGGALLALSSEAVTPANRGPGLGIFFTWYYGGMTVAPIAAGWLRDVWGDAGAPLLLSSALLVVTVLGVLLVRLLQVRWPIARTAEAGF